MGQPIRKSIQQQNNTAHEEKPFYTLLIDGNNLLRISMKDSKTNGLGIHYGGIFQFFLQVKLMMRDYRYDYVYIVFDDADSGILRYNYYHEYKANRDKQYGQALNGEKSEYWKKYEATLKGMKDAIYRKNAQKGTKKQEEQDIVDENFSRERDIIMDYCEELSIRTLFDDKTEGDDIIAYYVLHKKPEERIIIMSTDNDLTQLISPTVSVYNKQLKKYLSVKNFQKIKGIPVENVLIKKVFCGDTSDNIGNVRGVSEARLMELMPEIAERPVEIREIKERAQKMIDERVAEKKKPLQWHENIIHGISNKEYDGDFYEINEKIINLKKPLLTKEAQNSIEGMMYAPMDPEGRSYENLYKLICRDRIENLMDANSFSSFFAPFKELSNREFQKFKNAEKS